MNFRYRFRAALAAPAALLVLLAPGLVPAAQELTYRLILKHGIVGTQQMGTQVVKVAAVDTKNGSFDVDTRMNIDFTPFIFNHVKVQQATREVWRNGAIQSFESKTNDRGKKYHIQVSRHGDGLVVNAGDKTQPVSEMAAPASYWYEPLFKERSQFFDTKTGKVKDQNLVFVGTAQVKYRGGQLPVRHYRVANDKSQREFWYFETGVMYMMRWEEDEGGTVTYVLE